MVVATWANKVAAVTHCPRPWGALALCLLLLLCGFVSFAQQSDPFRWGIMAGEKPLAIRVGVGTVQHWLSMGLHSTVMSAMDSPPMLRGPAGKARQGQGCAARSSVPGPQRPWSSPRGPKSPCPMARGPRAVDPPKSAPQL